MIAEIGYVLEPTFFANGAEVGGDRERALGSPTHPLAHRGAWRRKTGRGSSAPPLRLAAGRRRQWRQEGGRGGGLPEFSLFVSS
jgi:hypothetical protein